MEERTSPYFLSLDGRGLRWGWKTNNLRKFPGTFQQPQRLASDTRRDCRSDHCLYWAFVASSRISLGEKEANAGFAPAASYSFGVCRTTVRNVVLKLS